MKNGNSSELSLIVVAERIVFERKAPINIYELFDLVAIEKELSNPQKAAYISQFYSDLTTSARFSYVGDNTWDLKENQKIELWEKDGSFYNEYTEVDFVDEDAVVKKPRKTKKAKASKKVDKEVITPEVIEEVVAPEVIEEVVEKSKNDKTEAVVEVVETEAETVDEVVFEDFDEDKYNEYMDTYEDRYDKKK